MRPSRRRRALAAFLALVLGTVCSIGGAELVLRVVGYEGQHARIHSVFDPRFGTVRRDSWVFDMQIGPREAELRGQRVPLAKPSGEKRVLFIGDSGTEGAFVTLEESYPRRFAALMRQRRPGQELVAINAGVFGMTTLDELHFLSRLLPLKPDVVVLGLFLSNDINFNLGHVERRKPADSGPSTRLRDYSALAHFVYLRTLGAGASMAPGAEPAQWLPREVQLIDRYGFHMLNYPAGEVALYMREASPLVERAYGVLEQALLHFERIAKEQGFRFAVLLIPAPSAVSGSLRLLHFPEIYDYLHGQGVDVEASDLDVELPRRRVMALCKRLGMLCIDPTDRLAEIGMGVFFPNDEHPTVIGHATLAAALAERAPELLD